MPGKKHAPDEILEKLRKADELKAHGATAREIARALGVAENTYQRWRQHYGGLDGWQKRRLGELEDENIRLKQIVAELSIDMQRLREYARALESGDVSTFANGVKADVA